MWARRAARRRPAVSSVLLVDGHVVDISDRRSVAALADAAGAAGSVGGVHAIVNAAGVSPGGTSTDEVLRVDLLGCAYVIDEFLPVAGPGTSLVCISSIAGQMASLPAEAERYLATAPTDQLLDLDVIDLRALDPPTAYAVAKRANQLRVEGAAGAWGARGARVNAVSPGLIGTRMARKELGGPLGHLFQAWVDSSATGRLGTPDEVAAAVEFLTSPQAAFITGTDLLVDGGVIAAARWAAASTRADPL